MEGSKLTFVPDYFVILVKSSQQEKKKQCTDISEEFPLTLIQTQQQQLIPNIHNMNSLICSIYECTRLGYKSFHTVLLHIRELS